MQIKCLSNGSYLLKGCHNPFGKGFQPPRPYGKIPVEHLKSLHGASLTQAKIMYHIGAYPGRHLNQILRKFKRVLNLGCLSSTSHDICWSTSHNQSQLLLLQHKPVGENIISISSIPISIQISMVSVLISISKSLVSILNNNLTSYHTKRHLSNCIKIYLWLCYQSIDFV